MKYFLIVYDPRHGLIEYQEFGEDDRQRALDVRFERELSEQGRGLEVVLLGADSLEGLKRTHARYFDTPAALAERLGAG